MRPTLFTCTILAGLAVLAVTMPALAQTTPAAPMKVLRVVPQADVVVTDPLYTTASDKSPHFR